MTGLPHAACLFLLCFAALVAARAAAVDAPELARPGPHAVGLLRTSVEVGVVPDADAAPGSAPQSRRLQALLWYPAAGPAGAPTTLESEVANHRWRGWASAGLRLSVPSIARSDAAPLPGTQRLPLVLISHGLLNIAENFHALAEHLASRGYAVMALQHRDETHADPLRAALTYRPLDQAAALRALRALDGQPGAPLRERLDLRRIALIGYSMGGYGALLSAGARLDKGGMAYGYAPHAAVHAEAQDAQAQALRERLGALVLFAPWGAQASIGAFKPAGLAGVRAPVLAIAGDQDDVSGYLDGVRSAWEALRHAPRTLLTFENARHNIALAAPPQGLPAGFRSWESLEEPVWRRDRLVDINNHFITAFLDLHLRGEPTAATWLNLAHERASDGAWPVPFGTPASADYAGPPKPPLTHWQGFQRRWALGLRLERRDAAQP